MNFDSGPQHVELALAHAVDVALQFLIGVHGVVAGKVVVGFRDRKQMFAPVFRVLGPLQQMGQHVLLQSFGFVEVPFQFPLSGQEELACYACQIHCFCLLFNLQS